MNTRSSTLRLAVLTTTFALVSTHVFAGNPSPADPAAQRLAMNGSLPVNNVGNQVQIGSCLIHVVTHLGRPSAKLPDGTWLYKEYRVEDGDAKGTLVVRFNHGRVSDLSLVTQAVAMAMIAPQKAADPVLVADRH